MSEEQIKQNQEMQELFKKMQTDAKKYVYNLLELGNEFNEEEYDKIVEEQKKGDLTKLFKDFDDETFQMNMNHLLTGYGPFGTKFIETLMTKDPESAKVLFESVTQAYLDLLASIQQTQQSMEEHLKQKLAEDIKDNKSN